MRERVELLDDWGEGPAAEEAAPHPGERPRRRWSRVRRLLVVLLAGAVLGGYAAELRHRDGQRARAEALSTLDVALGRTGVSPGTDLDAMSVDLAVRNLGPLPVTLVDVRATGTDAALRRWEPGRQAVIEPSEDPLDVRLHLDLRCDERADVGPAPRLVLRVRRTDGSTRELQPRVPGLAEYWAGEGSWRCAPVPLDVQAGYTGDGVVAVDGVLRLPVELSAYDAAGVTVTGVRIGAEGTSTTVPGLPLPLDEDEPVRAVAQVRVEDCAQALAAADVGTIYVEGRREGSDTTAPETTVSISSALARDLIRGIDEICRP